MPGANNSGAMWQIWGAEFDLDLRHPAMDQRLIELCFSIPEEQYASPAADRWLLRRAMEGRLPAAVLWERRRGMLHADLGHRLVASSKEVDEALSRVAASPLATEYLDVEAMRAAWRELRASITIATTERAVLILLRGLELGIFLTDRDRAAM